MKPKTQESIIQEFFPCKIHSVQSVTAEYFQILFYSKSQVWEDYLPGQFLTLSYKNKSIKCWIASHLFGANLPSIIIHKNNIPLLNNGDELLLSKPQGTFVLNPISNYKRSFIFLAQDEGIIPIYVMLQSLLYIENRSKASVYAISKNNEALFYDDIDFLKNMVHGRICCETEINKNTFSLNKLNELFEFVSKEQSPIFYVCGRKTFIDKVAYFMLKKKILIHTMQYFKTPLS